MRYLYNAGIYLYNMLLHIAAPFNEKAAAMLSGRRETFGKLDGCFKKGDRVFWFHCSSLGEFEQGRPVMEKIKDEQPEIKILLSFYSPSGYSVRHNYDRADVVVYLPADTMRNARRFISMARPEKAIFIKYEFWFNYLAVLQKRQIPLYLISGIFRPSQTFFSWYGRYFLKILKGFTRLFVQDSDSAAILQKHGIDNYTVSGDTRFDRVMAVSRASEKIPLIEKFSSGSRIIVAGSSWPAEEEIIVRYMGKGRTDMKYIIAPHNIADSNIDRIERLLELPCIRYSELDGHNVPPDVKVLIIDSIGILSSVYRYADIAVIGGGFGRGIHNILEAATWAVPVMFGPRHEKFKEALDLIELGGAVVFDSYEAFSAAADSLLDDAGMLEAAGMAARTYINNNLGASDKISEELLTRNC
ncbi:MAG: glycosyltransferase N-terminal domain-containing protein [Bacteroidales bacterium]|nr:glycosyltransferase N-terminal domain-containing protein [Bacteroidales bacterium]